MSADLTFSTATDISFRICDDGVLVYDNSVRTTHLIPTPVWEFFMEITEGLKATKLDRESDVDFRFQSNNLDTQAMINALIQAGLLKCN